jgi:hypothetical protein
VQRYTNQKMVSKCSTRQNKMVRRLMPIKIRTQKTMPL